jgi:membrane-bound inhibitor of C-type lysozyme
MRNRNLLSAVAAAAGLLAAVPASAGERAASNEWREVAYSCDSGQALTVAFRESGSAVRVMADENKAVKLIARPAKTGFRYSDSRYELRGGVDAVTWKIGSRTPVKCTSDDPAAASLAAVAAR